MKTAFENIPVPERQEKPRSHGLTMMIDWGMGLERQKDTLQSAGHMIDFAKVAAGIPRFMPIEILKQKLSIYREYGISTSPGGAFAELAFMQGRYETFVDEVIACGFDGIEISDNLMHFPPAEKAACIAHAKKSGLKVFGEVGKKQGVLDDAAVIADVRECLEAGANWVYLEAQELFLNGEVRTSLITELKNRFPPEKLIYELPVVILPGSTRDYKHKIATLLVRELGTEVNLANVEWDELYINELVRRGFAGDTTHPQGAYRLAGFEPDSDH